MQAPTPHPDNGVRITGVLQENAAVLYQAGIQPSAMLVLKIAPEKGLPFLVRKPLGTDPNAHMAAQAKLVVMKRGDQVAVYAKGFQARDDHDVATLFALDVSDILPLGSSTRNRAAGDA
jgi:antitoxin component of RelBE/YafQ-DinJ toxin-antitoxin module